MSDELYVGCLVMVVRCNTDPELIGKVGTIVEFTPAGGESYKAPDGFMWNTSTQYPGCVVELPHATKVKEDGQMSNFILISRYCLLPISGGEKLVEQEKDLVLEE